MSKNNFPTKVDLCDCLHKQVFYKLEHISNKLTINIDKGYKI